MLRRTGQRFTDLKMTRRGLFFIVERAIQIGLNNLVKIGVPVWMM